MNDVLNGQAKRSSGASAGQSAFGQQKVLYYTARSPIECVQKIKNDLGLDAIILQTRNFKKGAWFGRWGGVDMVEMSVMAPSRPPMPPAARSIPDNGRSAKAAPADDQISRLESEVATLTASIKTLVDNGKAKAFVPAAIEPVPAASAPAPQQAARASRKPAKVVEPKGDPYPSLMMQLLDAEVAGPLAKQLVSELPPDLSSGAAASQLRTIISQRLKIANRVEVTGRGKMKMIAFFGTTGVGKTTTITKLAAQYALMERRKVGIITLDTQRIAAAQQLQTYGQLLKIPVSIAHDQLELMQQLEGYQADGAEIVLLDTAGRSPNDMLPISETAHLFADINAVHKFLAIPATLSAREMDNIVARFQNSLGPEAIVLTKLDEASDNTCFGKLLTIQAKYGLPLAYVTTGQKVPDDIAFPDSHAIAARLLSAAIL